jgi:5'(3')-deoxyribonucleotidase
MNNMRINSRIILVDVDSVVADLVPAWLDIYNNQYSDSLTKNDILEWDIHKFTKPECGKKIYNILKNPGLYKNVKPIDGALSAIKILKKSGHRIIYASSGIFEQKAEWLKDNGFLSSKNSDWHFADDLIFCGDKTLIYGDWIIDDKYENCHGRQSILFDQPWNREYGSNFIRATDWIHVLAILKGDGVCLL